MIQKHVCKRFVVPLDDGTEHKARIHLTKHYDALIYFYLNGISGSKAGYMSSDVQFQLISSKELFHHNNEQVIVQWKCGDQIKKQSCSIKQYLEPDTKRALGFHTLFKQEHFIKLKGIISISIEIKRKKEDKEKEKEKTAESFQQSPKNHVFLIIFKFN